MKNVNAELINLPSCDLPIIELVNVSAGIKLHVSPYTGGEMSSLGIMHNSEWIELLNRADEFGPLPKNVIWRGRAPLLFPAVGRNYTNEQMSVDIDKKNKPPCGYMHYGKKYKIPIHGFVMDLPWELDSFGVNNNIPYAVCRYKSDAVSRKYYPFKYELVSKYELTQEKKVIITYTVLSMSDGMFFSVGNHLTLKYPFTGKDSGYNNGMIKTRATKGFVLSPYGITSEKFNTINYAGGVTLENDKYLDMVIGGYNSVDDLWVDFIDSNAFTLRVEQREVVPSGGMPKMSLEHFYYVFWGQRENNLYCVEPWYGAPNSLNTRKGVVMLNKNESCTWQMELKIIG
ncbi:MAG: hypothetical protein WC955_01385 [Elusimicrobiota bacterium]